MPLDTRVLTDQVELAVRKGYTGPKEQEWVSVSASGNPARYAVSEHSAYLFAAANTSQAVTFEQVADAIAIRSSGWDSGPGQRRERQLVPIQGQSLLGEPNDQWTCLCIGRLEK